MSKKQSRRSFVRWWFTRMKEEDRHQWAIRMVGRCSCGICRGIY